MLSTLAVEPVDGELEQRVVSFLLGQSVPALRRIKVLVNNGVVTLKGRVQSYYERQLCLSCCQRVAGVRQLVDLIEVATARQTA